MRVIRGELADDENDRMVIDESASSLLGRVDSNDRSPDPESSDHPSGTSDHRDHERGGRQAPSPSESGDQGLSLDDRIAVAIARRRGMSLRELLGVAPGWAGGLTDEQYVRELEALAERIEARP